MRSPLPKELLHLLMFEMNLLERQGHAITWQTFVFHRSEVLEKLSSKTRAGYRKTWKWLQKNSDRAQRNVAYEIAARHK